MIRHFELENGVGERWSLTDTNTVFLIEPEGLGFSRSIEFGSLRDGFFAPYNDDAEQIEFRGTLKIANKDGRAYQRYQELVDWMMQADSLKLVYRPAMVDEFFLNIRIQALEKTELTMVWLDCPITLTALSPWYSATMQRIVVEQEEFIDQAKRYDYTYSYRYNLDQPSGTVQFEIGGHLPADIDLRLVGPAESPKVTVRDESDGVVVGIVDLTGLSVPSGSTLLISSVRNTAGVWLDGESVIDRLELYADVSVYPHVRQGHTATLKLELGGGSKPTSVQLRVFEYYVSR